jgi:hypothetical protein
MLIALTLLFSVGVWAQGGGSGDLTGTVYDPTGAVVPGAKLTLTNDATGTVRTAETNEVGLFRFVSLPIVGTYNLKVAATGFKTYEASKIIMTVGRTVTLDVKLEIGAAQEVLTVEAGEQLVQTSESQLSGLVDRRVWQSIPLEQRNQNSFINILAGVVPDVFGGTTRGPAVNGMRPGTGNFLVEGFDNNDQGQGGRGALVAGGITSISPEAIQEYRVITNGYAAEYGKGGGFINDLVLRSGTNEIHGGLFWFNRVQALAANDFFTNKALADGVPGAANDFLVRNQFGGSLGGPILKDRSFIYGSYEGHLRRQAAPFTGTVPTQEFLNFVRTGAFATFMENDPNGLCNNQTVFDNFFGPGQVTAAPCPGLFSASTTTGPIFDSLFATQFFPLGTATGQGLQFTGSGPWTGRGTVYPVPVYARHTEPNRTELNEHRVSIKSDNKITSKDQLNYTLLWEDSDTASSIYGGYGLFGPPYNSPGGSVLTGLTWQRTFTPTVLNTTKFSYLRHTRDFPNEAGPLETLPSVLTTFDGMDNTFGQGGNLPQLFTENLFQLQNHTAMVKGAHTFKFGGEYRRTRNGSVFSAGKNGSFGFYAIEDLLTDGLFSDTADLAVYGAPYYGAFYYTQASVNPSTCDTTGPTAGFNCDRPEYYRGYRANEIAWYVQDDWKIHPRVTLNMGVRWEYFGPPHNFRSGIDSNFFFGNGITPITSTGNVFFPTNEPIAAMVRTGSFQQRDHSIWEKDLNNFAPRFGFAYDVMGNQKWVLRGAYGIYYDRMWNNLFENIRFNPPLFAFSLNFFVPASSGQYSAPFTTFGAFNGTQASSPRHMDQNLVTAYSQQFNLSLQHQFARDYVVELNYVGTLGNKLLGVLNINTFDGRTGQHDGGPSGRINTTISNDNFRTNLFRSNYHGAQVVVRKNFSSGLQFNANYTWGHAIDYVSDAFNNGRGTRLRPADSFNWRIDRGDADFDIRHRFVVSYFYELPWMKSNRWFGGWMLSGISTLQTGVPVPLIDNTFPGGDSNQDGVFEDRPFWGGTGDINNTVMDNQSPADGYFDTSQFATLDGSDRCPADLGRAGVIMTPSVRDPNTGVITSQGQWWCNSGLGRGALRGPGFVNFDFGVHKPFKITERVKLTFQANFFNIFNHPNFGVPQGNLNDGDFGKSTFTLNGAGGGGTGARVTQLALRLEF